MEASPRKTDQFSSVRGELCAKLAGELHVRSQVPLLAPRKVVPVFSQIHAQAADGTMRLDLAAIQFRLHGNDVDVGKRAREQFHETGFQLQHHGTGECADLWNHAGVENLVAEPLLAPNQQRSFDPATGPARYGIIADDEVGRLALPAALKQRPAFGEAAGVQT